MWTKIHRPNAVELLNYCEDKWDDIIAPINTEELSRLLELTKYNKDKTTKLIQGFTGGFDLVYRGPENRCDEAENIPIRIGSREEIWNKLMKETKERRYAGPFTELPFTSYVQSPIGLVPKAGNKTRLIFHLSYDFGEEDHQRSINYHTPKHLCTVKYRDLDFAVKKCLQLMEITGTNKIHFAKSDCSSTFHILPIKISQRCYLVMKIKHPVTRIICYFIDKCLPFGASISCANFQSFSDALKHVIDWKADKALLTPVPVTTNYPDDFLFIAIAKFICNQMMRLFLEICKTVGCPISMDKTEWSTELIVFLGVLLNGMTLMLSTLHDKRIKVINLLKWGIEQRKVTIHYIQKLTGTLNFLNRAIVPGRIFTRGMYEKLTLKDKMGKPLKQHHHVYLSKDFVQDAKIWLKFLVDEQNLRLYRPFVDFSPQPERHSKIVMFYSDASRNPNLGMGAVFNKPTLAILQMAKKLHTKI